MKNCLVERIKQYVNEHAVEAEELLKELGKIPAPSHQEDLRAEFCKRWFLTQGAVDVMIDDAKNVVCKINYDDTKDLAVFMAHTDIVFPDLEPLQMEMKGRKLYAPGIGDDTANLVNLMMAAKYILHNQPKLQMGFLIVANSCEEGLGNLDGSKEIIKNYGERIKVFYSFDGYIPQCTCTAVGSYRYRITVKTEGGHSWLNFGRPNAIEILSRLIEKLYQLELPEGDKTTFNVGYISGGTTVNTIAQEASMLFEFRAISQNHLEIMQKKMMDVINSFQGEYEITTEVLGIRPGNGDLDQEALREYTEKSSVIIREFSKEEPDYTAFSTDSNIPLSRGILANTMGAVRGAGAHTREEWVDLDSIPTGMSVVLATMLMYEEC